MTVADALNPLKRIWWLASYPKSGNTWARFFVNAYVSGQPVKLNTVYQYATDDLRPFTYRMIAARPLQQMTPLEVLYHRGAQLCNLIYEAELRGMHRCLKTHHGRVSIEGVPLIPTPMTLGATYLVRDPRDVCISYARHLHMSIDETIEFMSRENAVAAKSGPEDKPLWHHLGSWSDHVHSWTDGNKAFPTQLVRYEDMLGNPDAALRLVLNGLGLASEIDEQRFAFALEQTNFAKLQSQEADDGFNEQRGEGPFFAHGRAGRWREVLTANQVRAIESAHAEVMSKVEYQLEETEQWHSTLN